MPYFVYLVKCSDGSYYCGYTTDVSKRIQEHNTSDKGAKYTRAKRPVGLTYSEEFQTLSGALKRERLVKKMTHIEKENISKDWNTTSPRK